jgi:hypothetical protein
VAATLESPRAAEVSSQSRYAARPTSLGRYPRRARRQRAAGGRAKSCHAALSLRGRLAWSSAAPWGVSCHALGNPGVALAVLWIRPRSVRRARSFEICSSSRTPAMSAISRLLAPTCSATAVRTRWVRTVKRKVELAWRVGAGRERPRFETSLLPRTTPYVGRARAPWWASKTPSPCLVRDSLARRINQGLGIGFLVGMFLGPLTLFVFVAKIVS